MNRDDMTAILQSDIPATAPHYHATYRWHGGTPNPLTGTGQRVTVAYAAPMDDATADTVRNLAAIADSYSGAAIVRGNAGGRFGDPVPFAHGAALVVADRNGDALMVASLRACPVRHA